MGERETSLTARKETRNVFPRSAQGGGEGALTKTLGGGQGRKNHSSGEEEEYSDHFPPEVGVRIIIVKAGGKPVP